MLLKIVDAPVTLMPEILSGFTNRINTRYALFHHDFGMNFCNEDLFVVRTVEYPNSSPFGKALSSSPQEIMVKFFSRRLLKAVYLTSLGINSRHDIFDCTVFTCRIHSLEYQQDRE